MSVDDVIMSGLLNVIGLFSRDVIGWKTRVEFVNSHWSVSIRLLLVGLFVGLSDDHTIRTTDTPGFKPFTLLISVYYSLIYPYLNYTCTLWGNNYNAPLSQIVKLQNKAVRVINEIS